MKTSITEELLFDYFAGRVTSLQREMIKEWAKEPVNEELFYECLHKWEIRNPQYQTDVLSAHEKYRRMLYHTPSPSEQEVERVISSPPTNTRNWLRWVAAASILLLFSLGSMWKFQDRLLFVTYTTAYGEIKSISLSDGSQVTLNANSSLKVPRFGIGQSSRQVYLKGEANFSIVHTPENQRFVVQTDSSFSVEVLGTEFSVLARPSFTGVVLTRGKVKVHYRKTERLVKQLTMLPGDRVKLDSEGQLQVDRVAHPENFSAWKDHRYVFENAALWQINRLLRDNYGLQVEIRGKKLAEQTLSGSFQARTADELLQAISEVLEVNVVRQDSRVIFTDNH
jgi:transmembrane sensor